MLKKDIGEIIPGLEINGKPAPYGVLNEKEVRAGAGITLVLGLVTFIFTILQNDLTLFNFVVPIISLDFLMKITVGPKYSPFSIIGGLLVSNQKPEWVGAMQKRFAWTLGFVMSLTTMSGVLVINAPCGLPMILCLLCLIFMWAESVLGYCVGCSIYVFLRDRGYIKKQKYAPVCAGGVCDISKK